ncbi:MAG: leucine-rich repeat protein [Paludibacteraceae bacterium]|nr:leucine-rich repeat protein [Paludibacteraceae bacterium]
MRKVLLSLIALFCSVAMNVRAEATFGLAGEWYNVDADATGIAATLDAKADVTASGTISYDAATHTLTLDNATVECAAATHTLQFSNVTEFTINLIGDNVLSQTNESEYKSGLLLDMYSNPNVTITGSGKLSVRSYKTYPIQIAGGSLTIDNTTLEAYSTNSSNYNGIGYNSTGGALTINNSCVKATQISYLSAITLTNSQILQPKGDVLSVGDYTYGAGKAILKADDNIAYDLAIYPSTFTVDDVKYELYRVTYGNRQLDVPAQDWTSASLVIPDSVTYADVKFQVHHIKANAFQSNASITSVDLSCEEVWYNAFYLCSNLETVTLREGVNKIAEGAFSAIKATSMHLPASLTILDENSGTPFCYNKFTEFTLAAGNTSFVIGEDGALYNTARTKLLAYPYDWAGGKFASVPESVVTILDDAFNSCENVADTLILPENLTSAKTAFMGASMKCVILNSKNLNNAFQGSDNIKEVIIGKGVELLGNIMFTNCSNIRKIVILANTQVNWATNPFGSNYENDVFKNAKVYVHCNQLAAYQASTATWGHFTNLVDTFMHDVTVVAENATYEVEKLSACSEVKVTVTPNSGYSFVNWDNGETENPLTLTVTSDTTITANIKKELKVNDTFTAKNAEGIDIVYRVLTKAAGDMTVSVGYKENYSYTTPAVDIATAGELIIPAKAQYFDEEYDVVHIGSCAFGQCTNLTKVTIPASVKKIEYQAFRKCTSLAVVSLSEGLEELVYGAFQYCPIVSITLPNSLTRLGSYTFYQCAQLESVNIPEGIDYLEEWTFGYCAKLEEITIPSSVKYVDRAAFAYCSTLATINWTPANIERIGSDILEGAACWNSIAAENGGKYMNNFLLGKGDNVSGLTEFNVKAGTRVIAAWAVQSLSSATTISIPSSVTAIGECAFHNATALKRCTLETALPPVVYEDQYLKKNNSVTANDVFGRNPTVAGHMEGSTYVPEHYTYNESLIVYVPKAAVDTFRNNDQWKDMRIRPIGGWTVTFIDGNGNQIGEAQQVEEGQMPTLPNAASVPAKNPTTEQVFEFNGKWELTNGAVVAYPQTTYADITYTAQYDASPRPYTVKFVNYDGTTELDNQVINYGSTITYGGTTPTREQDAQYKYTFNGWDPAFEDGVTTVTGDMTFTATYSTITQKYAVAFYPSSADAVNGTNAYVQKQIAYGSDLKAIEAEAMGASSFAIPECYKLLGWTTNGIDLYALTTVSEAVKLFPLWNTNATFSVIFKNRANDAIIDTYDNVDCHWEATAPTSDVEGKHWEWESDEWKSVTKDLVIYGSLVENGGTGIDDVQGNGGQCTKVMIDGQLYIILGEHMYDAQGKMVK